MSENCKGHNPSWFSYSRPPCFPPKRDQVLLFSSCLSYLWCLENITAKSAGTTCIDKATLICTLPVHIRESASPIASSLWREWASETSSFFIFPPILFCVSMLNNVHLHMGNLESFLFLILLNSRSYKKSVETELSTFKIHCLFNPLHGSRDMRVCHSN